ncbi:MAG: hypothetical protein R3330_14395 [Saprospiraceae bacterium]|nr:hypothetical protein [Saprospiraceae bacterium]
MEDNTVTRKTIISLAAVAALCAGNMAATGVAHAGNMFNFMNPNKWFGDNDRDYYRYRGYGYGPYGYGGGPWGYGYGPYGYGGGPWGYGGGPWGYGGGRPSTIVVNPSSGGSDKAAPRLPE